MSSFAICAVGPGTDGIAIRRDGKPNGNEIDGLCVYGNTGLRVHHVVIDHCSVQWAVDENGEAFGNVTDTVFQWCIFGEGTVTGHEKGPHNKAVLLATGSQQKWKLTVGVHHCLLANSGDRNPNVTANYSRGKPNIRADIRNNVVYNWSGNNPAKFSVGAEVNFVNNHYIMGPDTSAPQVAWLSDKELGTRIYSAGNIGPKCPAADRDGWKIGFFDGDAWRARKKVLPASEADLARPGRSRFACDHASGRSVARPDLAQRRRHATAPGCRGCPYHPGSENRNGHRPHLASQPLSCPGARHAAGGHRPDGMPDEWEKKHGLDPQDPRDGSGPASNGYTNVEDYLNEFGRRSGRALAAHTAVHRGAVLRRQGLCRPADPTMPCRRCLGRGALARTGEVVEECIFIRPDTAFQVQCYIQYQVGVKH